MGQKVHAGKTPAPGTMSGSASPERGARVPQRDPSVSKTAKDPEPGPPMGRETIAAHRRRGDPRPAIEHAACGDVPVPQ